MKVRHIINLSLSTLWVLACTGLFIAGTWILQPAWINSLDRSFRETHLYHPQQQYDRILARLAESQDWAAAEGPLLELLDELEDVQPGDHNSFIKRSIYYLLVSNTINTGNFQLAAALSHDWLAYMPNDVLGRTLRNRALYLEPGTRSEGLLQMMILKKKFPHSLTVADGIATTFASNGELGRAFREYEPFLPFNQDSRKRNIDDILSTSAFTHDPSKHNADLSMTFLDGEIIEVVLSTNPAGAGLMFETAGLTQTPTGFIKYATPATASLNLQAIQVNSPIEVSATVRVPPPQTLTLITEARFRPLVMDQLIGDEHKDTRDAYERYTRS